MGNSRPKTIKIAAILWLVACVIFYMKQGAQVAELQFADSDDYMRLVQVSRWIDEAGWNDLTQPRMNPPGGVEMHWTRLPDVPIAGVIVALEHWVGRHRATVVAAFAAPALMLLSILLASAWAARPVLTGMAAPNAVLVTLMALPLIVQFAPGRLDHHSWQLLFAMLSMGALLRMLLFPRALGPAILAGCIAALALWVSVEALTWIFAFSLTLSVAWIFFRRRVLTAAVIYSFTLFGVCCLLLPLVRQQQIWLTATCDSFSVVYVVLAGVFLMFWGGLWAFGRHLKNTWTRVAAVGLCGVVSAMVVSALFPGCLSHPYGQVDPELARVWLGNIKEARSVLSLLPDRAVELPYWVASPVLGLVVALIRLKNTVGVKRLMWMALALHLVLLLATSLVQMRFLPLAHLYAVIPVAWLLGTLFNLVEEYWTGVRRVLLIVGSLLIVGPFPSLALMMAAGLPDTEAATARCDIRSMETAVSDATAPRVIAAFINPGAEILFRTPHSVLAAGYHRNAAGNLDVYTLFSAPDDQVALQIIDERNVDLVLVCPSAPEMGFYRDRGYPTFVERLIDGDIPPWLQPVPMANSGGEMLFQVLPPTQQ